MPEEPIKLTQIKPGSSTLQQTSVRAKKHEKQTTSNTVSQICSSGTMAPKAIIDHPELTDCLRKTKKNWQMNGLRLTTGHEGFPKHPNSGVNSSSFASTTCSPV
jgi:hypothetical protein